MNTVEFLRKILPATGLYVIARLTDKGFRHQVCDTIDEAAAYALQFDSQGVPTYHACAAFREREVVTVKPDGKEWHQVRIHKNVRALKAFWMDLDVEPGNSKKFESQGEALEALVEFCNTTQLPIPMVISSGNGIHTYWSLTHEVLPEQWKQTAEGLKRLAAHYGFKADPAVTADPARVLRPVGTWNRKDPSNPRPVECVQDAGDSNCGVFAQLVTQALKVAGIKPHESVRHVEAKTETLNQAFAVTHHFPPCSASKVAERCAQLRVIRDTRGQVSEPHWYAGIQLLCHSVEGDELIHQWSNGYAGYSREETARKIQQVRGQNLGPTLCSTFADRSPGGCDGCPFQGKISSPAQLGTHIASAPAPVIHLEVAGKTVEIALPKPPDPFTRGEKGGIYIEEEGITHKIYEYDCYPTEIAWDEQLGFETTRWRHFLPQEGWKECVIRSALLARPVEFEGALRDNHIQPLIRNKMAAYGDAYMRKLRTDTKLRKLFKAQGWKNNDTEFVLGDRLYRKDEVVQAGFSHGAKGFLEHFQSKGSLDVWKNLTTIFNEPGFEPHAFMLLTAFASPLLKLDARQGFTISALGDTGAGKSTMGKFMASVYGHPEKTWTKRNDTAAARIERIGAYYSLPVYMDEVTTITPKEVRELVYAIATGKGRDSLKQDRTLREGVEWATILVTSTNDSLQAKLQIEKQNAEAESMRLFEFRFPRVAAFESVAGILHATLADNYGVAGATYIQHLVNNRVQIKAEVHDFIEATATAFGMEPKERFWSQAIALTLYGGSIARRLGLIDFDPEALRPWMLQETQRMRNNLSDSMVGSVAVLGAYLNAHMGERLVITKLNAGMSTNSTRPMKEISQRYEKDIHTLWFPRSHIKFWMEAGHFNYNDIKDDLYARGVLLSPASSKVLGAGTDYTGSQVVCWKINTAHPELGVAL